MTLIEAMLATAILATVVTSVSVVIRTTHSVWAAHETDRTIHSGANSVLRHIVRQVRQAERFVAISGSADNSGSLTVESADGANLVWDHNASIDSVNYGITTASDLLAENISQLNFIGYKADGNTPTTDPAEIQVIKITVAVTLPSGPKTTSAWAWKRTW